MSTIALDDLPRHVAKAVNAQALGKAHAGGVCDGGGLLEPRRSEEGVRYAPGVGDAGTASLLFDKPPVQFDTAIEDLTACARVLTACLTTLAGPRAGVEPSSQQPTPRGASCP